jgi:DNA-binding NarL/FixJ family response regulator
VALVDDSQVVRERVATLLSSLEGIEVVGQAADVPGGRLLLNEHRPDLLILDIDLPGSSGITLLASAKKDNASLLIIMLTNYDHPKLRAECAALGADFYFCKPTEMDRAIETCEDLARRHGARLERGHSGSPARL